MLDINGWELIILVVVGVVVLGPERLPQYAARLGELVRSLRAMAANARTQLKEQMGPDFEDVDWKQYDPRQYDPRRIVREALLDDPPSPTDAEPEEVKPQSGSMGPAGGASTTTPRLHDATLPTPWDADAT